MFAMQFLTWQSPKIFDWIFPNSIKNSTIRLQRPLIIMKFNGTFVCCRFVAKFWNRSMQRSKHWFHHLMRAFTMSWCKNRRKIFVCALRIGCAICHRIKLAIHSKEPFRLCWIVHENCVLFRTNRGAQMLTSKMIWRRHSLNFHHTGTCLRLSSIKSFSVSFESIQK